MLEREHDSLVQALDALAGRQEWGVKLIADDDRLAEEARSRSAEVAALEDELGARTGGGAYMLRRRLERHVREGVDALGAELADDVRDPLPAAAVDENGRTALRELARERLAEPVGGARDERGLLLNRPHASACPDAVGPTPRLSSLSSAERRRRRRVAGRPEPREPPAAVKAVFGPS
jgi:hypothetical protein